MATTWWVFRRPLLRDPLFVVGLAVGVASGVITIVADGERGAAAAVLQPITALVGGLLLVGILGGSVRAFRAGRRAG